MAKKTAFNRKAAETLDSAFLKAVERGDAATVKDMLKDCPGVLHAVKHTDQYGLAVDYTALHIAAINGYTSTAQALLAAGAPVDAEDGVGQTPLMLAAMHKQPALARLLVDNGADPRHEASEGFTPLMYAARNGQRETAVLLLAKGAPVDQQDEAGDTALFFAIHIEDADGAKTMARFLLDNGANTLLRNGDGQTVAEAAREEGKNDIAIFIEDYAEQMDIAREQQAQEQEAAKKRDLDILTNGAPQPITVGKPLRFKR